MSEGSVHNMGSVYSPVSGITISRLIPSTMTENGWAFKDRSNPRRTIWQYRRNLENGRYDEIRLNHHEPEGAHYHIKKMLRLGEKPTKEEFIIG